jgi:hypothetical protein
VPDYEILMLIEEIAEGAYTLNCEAIRAWQAGSFCGIM